MKDLFEPFVSLLEVRVQESPQQWEILVQIIAGDGQSYATCDKADYSHGMPHPGPVLARILGKYNCPTR